MTTPRDLLFVAMDMPSDRLLDRGDLSLALAGAELIDLLGAGAVALHGNHLTPQPQAEPGAGTEPAHGTRTADPLLDEALALLTSLAEPELLDEWLWRRGRGLPGVYLTAFEAQGWLVRDGHRRWGVFPAGRLVLAESPERRRADRRWAADEPVLTLLAGAIGLTRDEIPDVPTPRSPADIVLDAVGHAVTELADERHRRARRGEKANATYRSRGY